MWEWPRPALAAILVAVFLVGGWVSWELTALIIHD